MFRSAGRESQEVRYLGKQPGEGIRKGNRREFSDPRALSEPSEPSASIALVVERNDQRLFEGRSKITACSVAQVVVKMNNPVSGSPNHLIQDPRIIQFAAQFSKCFIEVIGA